MAEDVQPTVSRDEYFWDPDDVPPPTGRKMHLLTRNGVEVIGTWTGGGTFIGWRPLFKATQKMKEQINRGVLT